MPIIDYSLDNLLQHLKVLDALGLWKITWDEVAARLGLDDPECAVLDEIDDVLRQKMVLVLRLAPETSWEELALALGLKADATWPEVVGAFYEKGRAKELAVT